MIFVADCAALGEQFELAVFVEKYLSERCIGVDDFKEILIDFEIVGSFFADGTFPLSDRQFTVDVGHDEASQIERFIVHSAVFRPNGYRNFIRIELTLQRYF